MKLKWKIKLWMIFYNYINGNSEIKTKKNKKKKNK